MFDGNYDIDTAFDAVQQIDHVMYLEDFDRGIDQLNAKLGINLKTSHRRRSGHRFEPDSNSINQLKEMLEPEYRFLNRLAGQTAEQGVS